MKRLLALLFLVAASAVLVACGGGRAETATEGASGKAANPSILRIEAEPGGQPAYVAPQASVKAGAVTLELVNASPIPHDLRIEDSSGALVGKTEVITASTSTGDTIQLKGGTYVFYCSVPGHREAGMEGTLTVE